ncbi:hypothetical protein AAFF_G00215400 [Aldrovandia affinis]|uniref:Fibronectin type-III domain-containing protein n=1 Tax=Aldrovandia affinis TaxID=143900 RepID=A0AAD7W512_9TELE|nr:hypothetical protein AAFF_G00215400 [Aldrovandia affinis]
MQQLRTLLILLFARLFHPAKGEGVSCLWEEYFHIGHNVSGACQLHHPAPPGCQGQSLRLSADGQVLLPYHHTTDTANFTIPTPSTSDVHLRCELACPGLQPNKSCDRTILGSYPPSPPSRPRCHIPNNGDDLHCAWHARHNPLLPATYTLAWEPDVTRSGFAGSIMASNASGVIPRKQFHAQSRMSVWVIASNRLGSERSEKATFNTGYVGKPLAPVIHSYISHPTDLEILWDLKCPDMRSEESDINCQAQYRRQDQARWTEGEDVAQDGFLLEGVQPFSVYMFRVRCACPGSNPLMSDWSEIYTAESTEAAPIGFLDVWIDSRPMDQALVWKELPVSMARGRVLDYLVTVERGGENVTIKISKANLGAREGKGGSRHCCRCPLTLLGVTGVHVSASTSQGHTSPTALALPLPTTGSSQVSVPLSVSTETGGRGFNVSWDPSSPLAETIQEYVVQQEEAGLGFTQGFDWMRTNKTLRSIILTGDFRNYTPYNLSLFGVFAKHSFLLGSAIAYTRQGVPPLVPVFQVSRISSSKATLTWEHIPLSQRRGVIQYYQLGQGNNTEYTVSGGVTSRQLSGLRPGQTYQFWISAKSVAGAGPRHTVKFSTPPHSDYHITKIVVPVLVFALVGVFFLLTWLRRREAYALFPAWCCEKIIVWTRPCPAVESDPNFSLLEVVEAPPPTEELTVGEEEQEQGQADEQEGWRDEEWVGRGRGRKGSAWRSVKEGYNEIVTAEGAGGGEGPRWSATETFFSDYEKHFMPSPLEVSCPGQPL